MRETNDFFIIDQRQLSPWRIFPVDLRHSKISHLIVPISTFQISRTSASKWDVYLYFECNVNFPEQNFPMNTYASNVEDINIHQTIERLSMSCIASFEEWSNIFRNRSFTLFKNDRDFRERTDSYHHQWQTCHLRVSPWASAHHKSPCSWLLLIRRAQRYFLTFRFGFPRSLMQSR